MFEIWGDIIEINALIISILTSSILTMTAYFLAGNNKVKQLFFGLMGAVLAFVLATFFIKPKRIITIEKQKKQ